MITTEERDRRITITAAALQLLTLEVIELTNWLDGSGPRPSFISQRIADALDRGPLVVHLHKPTPRIQGGTAS